MEARQDLGAQQGYLKKLSEIYDLTVLKNVWAARQLVHTGYHGLSG